MRYVFGDYTLDTQLQELCRTGQLIPLRPKVFQLLTYLLMHHGRVVPKAELLEQLWSGQFIGDATLNSCLKDLRHALCDSGSAQHVIHTLRSRGYRFVAAVEVQHEPSSDDLCQSAARPSPETSGTLPTRPATRSLAVEVAVRHCPACHQAQTPEAQFCPTCGQPLAPVLLPFPASSRAAMSPAPTYAMPQEYKNVTVLCCALTDAPARAAELGAEVMHELMHTLFAHAQHVVQRYAGTMTHWSGEGFTALFGAPVAYEDHAWRAVLAACELQEHLRQPITLAGQSASLTLSVTMGLHTGAVIVGRLTHAPQHLYTAAGPTTHLASRLQHLAEPGTLLMSETTYKLVRGGVQVCTWGTLNETALLTPCTVYTVQRATQCRAEERGRSGQQLSRFVGRERELAILHERLAQVRGGQGQVVSIVGEPGIGKSRLFYEFSRQLRDQSMTYCVGRCLSYGTAMPYVPVISLLREVCGINDTDPPAVMATKLQRCLQVVDMVPGEWAPYLQQLLGLPVDPERLATLSPEAIKRWTFAALRHVFLAWSQQQPLILMLEDAHWIDKTSEDFCATLVESLAGAPVLLLVTYRPGYRPPWLDKSYVTQLALQPLPAHESQQLVESLMPQQAVSATVLPALLTKAEGNPFFLEELAQTMLTRGNMLVHGDATAHLTLPDTIQGVIMARMDRLPEAARRLLQMASILGRTTSVKLLGALWEGPGEVEDHLATLQRLEFLYEQVGTHELRYTFKHALTQEVAYASMLRTHRQAFHTTIGQTLEAMYAGHLDDALDQLAYHFGRSTDAPRAISYLRQYGAKTARSFAHVEAVTAYQQALDYVEHLPKEQQNRCRLDILLRQTFSLSILGRFQDIQELLVPHQEQLEQLQEPALIGPYYFRLGMTSIYLGVFQQGLQHAQRALEAAQQCHDTAMLGMSHHLLAFAHTALGQYQQGVACGRQAVTLLDNTGEWHWLGLAYFDVGMNATFLGEFETALEALAHTRAIGEAREDPRLQHLAELYIGWIQIMRGEWEAGLAACQSVLARSPDPIAELSALQLAGIAYLEQGEPAQAIALLERAVRRTQQVQLRYNQGRSMALLGEALLVSKQLEPAYHLALQGLESSQEIFHPYGIGIAQRVLGRIAQARGDYPTAAQHLHEALQTFTTLHAQYEIARTHLLLAELACQQDNWEALAIHLSAAHSLFQRLHAPKYIARTEQLASSRIYRRERCPAEAS